MMTDHGRLLGQKIRHAREKLNLSQQELANQVGFSAHQLISNIEQGIRAVKAWELARIAKVLKASVSDFLTLENLPTPPVVLWRERPVENIEIKEADFLLRCQQYHHLEMLGGKRKPTRFPYMDVDPETIDYTEAEGLAEDIGKTFDLGARPANALVKILENRYRVKIWYQDLGEDGSAACVVGEDFGPAILMNLSEAPWRRNYDFAHELFHLITWKSISPEFLSSDKSWWEQIEKLANAFASSLLLPADSTRSEFDQRLEERKITWNDLIGIAREFDVSTEALLWRLVNLRRLKRDDVVELLENSHFRELDRATMHSAWWQPPPIPERFVRLAFLVYKRGKLSKAKLAQYLDTSLVDLGDKLLEYGYNEAENYETEVATA